MEAGLLAALRARGDLWSAAEQASPRALDVAVNGLNEVFPGGWPRGVLVEVLSAGPGFGEVSLFMALAVELTQAGREVAWVATEGLPCAPSLAGAGLDLAHFLWVRASGSEAAWAARELLASGTVALVLINRGPEDERTLRALALAAREGEALGVLLRGAECRGCGSPARFRFEFLPGAREARRLVVRKGRGLAPGTIVTLGA